MDSDDSNDKDILLSSAAAPFRLTENVKIVRGIRTNQRIKRKNVQRECH